MVELYARALDGRSSLLGPHGPIELIDHAADVDVSGILSVLFALTLGDALLLDTVVEGYVRGGPACRGATCGSSKAGKGASRGGAGGGGGNTAVVMTTTATVAVTLPVTTPSEGGTIAGGGCEPAGVISSATVVATVGVVRHVSSIVIVLLLLLLLILLLLIGFST